MEAMVAGRSKVLICLGGNFSIALPDPVACAAGMRKLDLTVHLNTKLNRSHLLIGKEAIILPVLGRTERDIQASGPQAITVEDSMSMVHASRGKLKPASDHLRSEPAIIAGMATATLPSSPIDWLHLIEDYNRTGSKSFSRISAATTSASGSLAASACRSDRPSACGRRHPAGRSSS